MRDYFCYEIDSHFDGDPTNNYQAEFTVDNDEVVVTFPEFAHAAKQIDLTDELVIRFHKKRFSNLFYLL